MNFRKYIVPVFAVIFVICLIYTRFVGLNWGLPYPMHPDERNMAVAIEQLKCDKFPSTDCYNPHFFAYGQLPLYVSYILIRLQHALSGSISTRANFLEAVIALRVIAATAGVIMVLFLYKIVRLLSEHESSSHSTMISLGALFLFIYSPGFIQFSHFGTTESLLILLYTMVIYVSLQLLYGKISFDLFLERSATICGVALAVKVSALAYVAVPGLAMMWYVFRHTGRLKIFRLAFYGVQFGLIVAVFFIILSPYNVISFQEFMGSMRYESDVGTGRYVAFYTRQFVDTIPVIFQFVRSFPYVLGYPVLVLFIGGFFLLPYSRGNNILRLAFLCYFLPSAFLFAKWTRFVAPTFPIATLIAYLFLVQLMHHLIQSKSRRVHESKTGKQLLRPSVALAKGGWLLIILICIVPGLAYVTIYQKPDVRFVASEWIYTQMPWNAYVLSETANVIDIPIPSDYSAPRHDGVGTYISFDHYSLDENLALDSQLKRHEERAGYVFIPSRRVFWNHSCLRESADSRIPFQMEQMSVWNGFSNNRCQNFMKKYPKLNAYYSQLFSGKMGFKKVAEFTSYPRIELFGKTIFTLADEDAEETWTVFDHPVVRIYKKTDTRN